MLRCGLRHEFRRELRCELRHEAWNHFPVRRFVSLGEQASMASNRGSMCIRGFYFLFYLIIYLIMLVVGNQLKVNSSDGTPYVTR